MSEKVIITGVNGFVGEHVAREFKGRNFEVIGVGHDEQANEKVSSLLDVYIQCDLLDENKVAEMLALHGIRAVIHLAGLAAVGQSFEQPQRFMTENGIMTHNVLAKAANDEMAGRVVVVSTGALYDPTQPLPLTELSRTNANSPYAVGKLMAEEVVNYHRGRGVDAVVVRPFNHIGPGQGTGFLLPDLYEQISLANDTGEILVGNIETRRDYTDVRDIARAYAEIALADTLQHSLYNICSGESLSGREIIDKLKKATQSEAVDVVIDQSKIRPTDISDIVGDASRLRDELGWVPTIPIDQTIDDFVASRR